MPAHDEVHEIGHHAGLIWKELDNKGPCTISALKKAKNLGEVEIQRAIGWLAREDKIRFEKKGKTVSVALK
jgi:hypothetical protein